VPVIPQLAQRLDAHRKRSGSPGAARNLCILFNGNQRHTLAASRAGRNSVRGGGIGGLRLGEIEGLLWENYHDGEIFVMRSIWNGRINAPKTRAGRAAVPAIKESAERLGMHRLRLGNPASGPIFPNVSGKPTALGRMVNRIILPALNRCATCGKAERDHNLRAGHDYERDFRFPEWHGWHAARRGLGSNLCRLGSA
jgi:ribosomal protein L32